MLPISESLRADPPLAAGLVAHWPLDANAGNLAVELVGAHDGTLQGATWAPGGVSCDGLDDYVEVSARGFKFETWTEITFAAWIDSDLGNDGKTHDIGGQWLYPTSPNFILTHHESGQYHWEIAHKGWVQGGSVSTTRTHVAGTYDGATMHLFVNGTEVGSKAVSSGPLTPSSAPFRLCGQADNTNWFAGVIADVKIWRRALAAEEIAALAGG